MSEYFDNLKGALQNYFTAIEQLKNPEMASKVSLRSHFERLDALTAEAPKDLHPQLRHYLTQKSYEKALNFLTGNADRNVDGSCSR